MFGNPVREAGLGGFLWRDQTILEEVKSSKKTSLKPMVTRAVVIALAFGIAAVGLYNISLYALVIAMVIGTIVRVFRVDRLLPQTGMMYTILTLTIGLVFASIQPIPMPLLTLVLGVVSLALLLGVTEGEVMTISSVGAAGLTLLGLNHLLSGYPLIIPALLVLWVFAWCLYAHKSDHFSPWLDQLVRGRKKLWEEPIRMPVGYHAVGTKALRTALKSSASQISARHRGSIAERHTAFELLDLPAGSIVFHDIPLPGADSANIDHLAVTPHGVFVIDTKLFLGEVKAKPDGTVIKHSSYGEQDLSAITRQMLWAKDAVQSCLRDVEVKSMVAIQKASMESMVVAKDKKRGNVAYVPLALCVRTIEGFPNVYDETRIKEIASSLKPIVENRKPVYSKKKKQIDML